MITYSGFYDKNLEWVGLERVQIVGSMTGGNAMGRYTLSPRFTSIMRIYSVRYILDCNMSFLKINHPVVAATGESIEFRLHCNATIH